MNSDIPKPVPVRATDANAPGIVSPCWSCRGPVAAEGLFCETCEAVQPPGQADHFARLSLDVSYEVDVSSLDSSYFNLQRRLHPDRFAAYRQAAEAMGFEWIKAGANFIVHSSDYAAVLKTLGDELAVIRDAVETQARESGE